LQMRKLERPSCLGLWESARGWLGVFADMPLLRIDLSPKPLPFGSEY
jgi:hypothetical protein